MNTYTVYIGPKPVSGSSPVGPISVGERSLTIVTGTMQDAMSIARTKTTHNEEITSIYTTATDVIVDYSVSDQCNYATNVVN